MNSTSNHYLKNRIQLQAFFYIDRITKKNLRTPVVQIATAPSDIQSSQPVLGIGISHSEKLRILNLYSILNFFDPKKFN